METKQTEHGRTDIGQRSVTINFHNHRNLLYDLREIAKAEHRTVEQQMFQFVSEGINRYIKK